MSEEKVYEYSSKGDGFSMWLDGKHVKVKNRILTLTQKQHDELRGLIKDGRHDISAEITYLDHAAAEAVAKAYLKSMPASAHQGGANSGVGKGVDKASTVKPLDSKIPPGTPNALAAKLAANKDALQQANKAPMEVIESDAFKANEIAPPSEAPVQNLDNQRV